MPFDSSDCSEEALPQGLIDLDKIITIISRLAILGLMVYLFVRLNNNVMQLVNKAYLDDLSRSTDNRLITPDVIMSLIGATAAQVGISIVAIIKWLFPERL